MAMATARPGSTAGSSSATWMDSPSSRAKGDREVVGVDGAELAGLLSVTDDAGDRVAPALVELDAVLGDLRVPERLGPQVEPQAPRTGDLVVALRDAGQLHEQLQELRASGLQLLEPRGHAPVERVLEKRSASVSSRSLVPK